MIVTRVGCTHISNDILLTKKQSIHEEYAWEIECPCQCVPHASPGLQHSNTVECICMRSCLLQPASITMAKKMESAHGHVYHKV